MLRKGVRVKAVQGDAPAAMYSLCSRPSMKARLITLTICNHWERSEVWRILERPGLGVRLDIWKGVLLERSVGVHARSRGCSGLT
jgi:hypothetical protein